MTNGTQYTISIAPTSDWRAYHDETEGDIGETITFTGSVIAGKLNVYGYVGDSVPEKGIDVNILITE